MRASLFYIVLFSLLSVACTDSSKELLGKWTVQDSFFSATYSIQKEEDKLVGLITQYNDGTTKFSNSSNKQYLFRGLYKEDNSYVDGLTGASKTNGTPKTLEIKIKSRDTLEVTTYTMNKPKKECWIRN